MWKLTGTLLSLAAATYLLVVGVEGIVVYHEGRGESAGLAWLSAGFIFCGLLLVILPTTLRDKQ